MQLEQQMQDVLGKFKALADKINPILERQQDLLSQPEQTEAIKAEIKSLGEKLDEHASAQFKAQEEFRQLQRAIAEIEAKNQRRGGGGIDDDMEIPSTPGAAFTNSEAYKAFLKDGGFNGIPGGSGQVKIALSAHGVYKRDRWYQKRADLGGLQRRSMDSTNVALPKEWDKPDVVLFNKTVPIHRQFLNILEIAEGADQVRIDRELRELVLKTTVKATISPAATTGSITSVAGMSTAAGFNTINIKINAGTFEQKTVTAIGTIADDGSATITFTPAMTGTANAGNEVNAPTFVLTPETQLSIESQDETEEVTLSVVKLMTHVISSEEILEDAARLENLINRRLLSRYARMESKQVFYGTGASNTVTGFFNDASVTTVTLSSLPAGTTKLDALLYGITVVATAEYMPTGILISWQDTRDILLTKGDDKHYVIMQAMLGGIPDLVWMVPFVPTNEITSGAALVGDFEEAATLFVRRDAEISVGQPNNTFLKDQKAVKIRGRFAFGVEVPAAVAIVDFS